MSVMVGQDRAEDVHGQGTKMHGCKQLGLVAGGLLCCAWVIEDSMAGGVDVLCAALAQRYVRSTLTPRLDI